LGFRYIINNTGSQHLSAHPVLRQHERDTYNQGSFYAQPAMKIEMFNKHRNSDGADIDHKIDVVSNLIDSLEECRSRYEEIQRIAKLGHWTLNLESRELQWSDELFRMLAVDPESFSTSYKFFLGLVHPEDRSVVRHAYADSLNNKRSHQFEHRLQLPDGSTKWVRQCCETEFAVDGKALRSIGTVQDISETKSRHIS